MSFVKSFFLKIGKLLLAFIRIIHRAICCRRKRQDTEMLLPLNISHLNNSINDSKIENLELQSWDNWNELDQQSSAAVSCEQQNFINKDSSCPLDSSPNNQEEDFFKDMVPQLRKPKKLVVVEDESNATSNRLAMDPKAILMTVRSPDLGLIDDESATNWEEDGENFGEPWDPDSLIREKKKAEREKRIAEHQRRKLEKESRRISHDTSLSNMLLVRLSETKDKTKNS